MDETKEIKNSPKLTIEKAAAPEKAEEKEMPQTEAKEKSANEAPTLKEVIREQAIEDEAPMSKTFTLGKILGGDILTTQTMRRQIWLFILITFFFSITI